MSIKLRDLIRNVRACKTAAEERAVIAKESALIRTAFKEQDKQYRHRNVAKLLFIHMLGYPSHFGQMECLKLIAANTFSEKRIGYLGLMLLLTDQEEVLTLVTNSLKNDLNHPNPFVVGLSLTAVGNIASPDMARDLIVDIDKHLKNDNDYLRKKAALACIRVFAKVPELIEDFTDSIHNLLKNRNHAVRLTGVQLVIDIIQNDNDNLKYFSTLVPTLVKELRSLLSGSYAPEYEVSGICDPFLQVNILHLLRLCGKNNEEASEMMNDVLAQVATNTETSKNAGNAILYECVQTIMAIQSESGLKVLAINILGRFLLNRDNNIRYVALNTLSKVIAEDAPAVQRHRNTIVDCLKDPDASIRQRALELIYALVNESNIQALAREMLNYLVVATNEQKASLCSRIADAVDRYAPTQRWHIDTLITMLSIAGFILPDESISSSLIVLIQKNTNLHCYVVHKLYWALMEDISQLALAHVGIWCIGEYGHLLLQNPPEDEETLQGKTRVEEMHVVELIQKITRHHTATDVTRAYGITAAVKLSARFQSPQSLSALRQYIETYKSSSTVDLQQRACEYSNLILPKWNHLTKDILASMPVIDITKIRARQNRLLSQQAPLSNMNDASDTTKSSSTISTMNILSPKQTTKSSSTNTNSSTNLLDLDDIFGTAAPPPPAPASATSTNLSSHFNSSSSNSNNTSAVDLLNDIFSSTGANTGYNSNPTSTTATSQQSQSNDLLGLMGFDSHPTTSHSNSTAPVKQVLRGYEKNGLIMDFELLKPTNSNDPSITHIACTFRNESNYHLQQFIFQAAFPKYIRLKMEPPSGDNIPGNNIGQLTQLIKIQNTNHGEKPIMMRIKLEFTINGTKVEDMAAIQSFPPNY